MENFTLLLKKSYFTIVFSFLLCMNLNAQCDSITPTFNVDLSAAPNMSWVSPIVARDGFCCGAVAPDKCLEFIITLNPLSAAVVFNIASGAIPPGALFYQIDCGPMTPVGSPICLNGTGPFHLTFCKPGNNSNTFSIETIPNPIFGPPLTLGDGCTGDLTVQFYDESTISWNSISPGPSGTYNNYLSCTNGCDTVSVGAVGVPPSVVQYEVCGIALNGCVLAPICDTLSVTFVNPISVNLNVPDTVLCYNETTVPSNPIITGGTGSYTYVWSNGSGSLSNMLGVGTHTLTVQDASGCSAYIEQVTVTQLPTPVVNAGADITACLQSTTINLNATSSNVSNVIWSGGAGTFSPNNISLNTSYQPTSGEIASGSIALTISSNDMNGCTNVSDNVIVQFVPVASTITNSITNVSCNGGSNGTISVNASGTNGPFLYAINGGVYSNSSTFSGLAAGNYSISIQNAIGCDTSVNVTISQPTPLQASIVSLSNVSCFGGNNGSINAIASGGTSPYSYSWNTSPVQLTTTANNLSVGTYTLTVQDANLCVTNITASITQPSPLSIAFSSVKPSCYGYSNGAISSSVSGGTGSYLYNWSTGASGTSIYSVSSGNYQLTITDSNGCQSSNTIDITDPPAIDLDLSPNLTICANTSTTINATATGGTGTYNYAWNPANTNSASVSVTPSNTITIYCTVSDNNGCQILDSTVISTIQLQSSEINAFISEDSICVGESVDLNGVYYGTDTTVTLSWQYCPSCPVAHTDQPQNSTNYILVAENACNQSVFDFVDVVIITPPIAALDPSLANVCQGEYFSVTNQGISSQNWTYLWTFSDGVTSTDISAIHHFDLPGEYSVTLQITDEHGCTSSTSNEGVITVNPSAIANFTSSTLSATTLNPDFEFTNYSSYANSYEWNFGDGASATTEDAEHTYAEYGFFTVTLNANNSFNCPGSTTLTVEIKPSFDIFVPNTFTPDGDDLNFQFLTQSYGVLDKGFELAIYNRWGEVIFLTNDKNVGWDGTYKGELSQDGVYTWVVRFRDLTDKPHEKNGHVALLR